jgi:hypothetical protein
MKANTIVMLLCIAAFGCESEEAPLSACVEGWWQDPAASTCACPGAAECDAADCQGFRVLGFTADGRSFAGVVRASSALETATPVGTLSSGTYAVENSLIRVTPGDAPAYAAETTCSAEELVFNGVVKVRPPQWLSAHLSTLAQP